MNTNRIALFALCATLLTPAAGHATEEFFGIIESRPTNGNAGTWVISGRKVEVTNNTALEEDNGPFVVGACVEVELKGKVAIEISTEEKRECR
jgi:hypothetical protein